MTSLFARITSALSSFDIEDWVCETLDRIKFRVARYRNSSNTLKDEAEVFVLIDYQLGYSINDKTTGAVKKTLASARLRNALIVILELHDRDPPCPTLRCVMKSLEGYERIVYANKSCVNGSYRVIDALIAAGYKSRRFVVFGLYTGSCVFKTAKGLARSTWGPSVTVVQGACSEYSNKPNDWRKYEDIPNLNLVLSVD